MTLGIEADGAIKGCPSLPTVPWTGGNIRDASLRDIWERSAPLRYMRDRTVDDLWGYCRTCYYADECRAGLHLDGLLAVRQGGQQPALPPPRAGDARQGKRERLVQVARAPGAPFDHGRFEIIVEDLPMSVSSRALLATATSPPTKPSVLFVRWRFRIRSRVNRAGGRRGDSAAPRG